MLWGIGNRGSGCSPRGIWGIGGVREKKKRDILLFHLIGRVLVLGEATFLASQPKFSPLRPQFSCKAILEFAVSESTNCPASRIL